MTYQDSMQILDKSSQLGRKTFLLQCRNQMLLEKQIMEQHLQETAGDLEFAERELSRRGSPTGTPPREDSEDGSPRQQTPSLRQVYADDPAHLKEENERVMEVIVQSHV